MATSDDAPLDQHVERDGQRRLRRPADRPDFLFWPMLFDNVAIRLLGSDDFSAAAKQQLILPTRPETVRCRSRSMARCLWSDSQRPTTTSTPVLAGASL
jgi:hypothetical protein